MKVMVFDLFLMVDWVKELGVNKVEFEDFLLEVDFIFFYILFMD